MQTGQNTLPPGKQVIAFIIIGMHGKPGNLHPMNDLAFFFGQIKLLLRRIIQILPFQKLLQQGLVEIVRHIDIQLNGLLL